MTYYVSNETHEWLVHMLKRNPRGARTLVAKRRPAGERLLVEEGTDFFNGAYGIEPRVLRVGRRASE